MTEKAPKQSIDEWKRLVEKTLAAQGQMVYKQHQLLKSLIGRVEALENPKKKIILPGAH